MHSPDGRPAEVILVRTPACHFCHDAEDALAALGASYALSVTIVEADSSEGRALLAEHRPPLAPLVLVDGVYFSAGRLPRRKLEKLLRTRSATTTAGA